MTPRLKIKPGVKLGGLQPEMCVILDLAPIVFSQKGYDCWLTSAVRKEDPGKHGTGHALDFDSSTNIPYDTGKEIEASMASYLGGKEREFGVIWHGPKFHLHVQFPRPES